MSLGKQLFGQILSSLRKVPFRFWEREMDDEAASAYLGALNTEVDPTDRGSSKVRVWDSAALIAAITDASIYYKFPGKANIPFPAVLTAVAAVMNKDTGTGSSSHPASQFAAVSGGANGSIDCRIQAQAQGSASIVPDIIPTITTKWGNNRSVMHYVFFLASPSTEADIRSRIETIDGLTPGDVLAWPNFNPESHTFVAKGARIAVSAQADSTTQYNWSTSSYGKTRQYGNGSSKDISTTNKSVTIEPTIHGSITVTGTTSDTASASASVDASTDNILTFGGSTIIAAITNTPSATSQNANGSVTPTSLSATSGATGLPSTGVYLFDVEIALMDDLDVLKVRATTFTFPNG